MLFACSDDEEGSTEELCAALGDGGGFADTFQDGLDPTDTDTALEQLRSARVELGELQSVAPSEVRGDVSTLVDYVQALLDALTAVDPGDTAAAVAAVQTTTAEPPDVPQSRDTMRAWAGTTRQPQRP